MSAQNIHYFDYDSIKYVLLSLNIVKNLWYYYHNIHKLQRCRLLFGIFNRHCCRSAMPLRRPFVHTLVFLITPKRDIEYGWTFFWFSFRLSTHTATHTRDTLICTQKENRDAAAVNLERRRQTLFFVPGLHTHTHIRNRNFRSAARAATGHVTPPPSPYVERGDRNGFHLARMAALPCRCFACTTKICGAMMQ